MGTASTELALPRIVEILGPEGEYTKKRLALRSEYGAIIQAAKKMTSITTSDEAEQATQYGRLLQNGVKEEEAFFKNIKSQIDLVKAPILAAEKEDVGPLNTEKTRLGGLLTAYQAEQRRLREIEEQKAREAAQKQAEEDAIQRALELAAAGESEAADAVLDEPVIAAPVVIAASAPKPTGSVARKNYDIEITDLKALAAAVMAGQVPLMAIVANESFIRSLAKSMKESFSMPGVKLVITESTSFRS